MPEEEADLDEDEGHREGDAGDRHRRAQLVVQQVLEREIRHGSGLRALSPAVCGRRSRTGRGLRAQDAANRDVDDRLDRPLLRPPVDPGLVALGHPQGDPAVDGGPDDLRDELGVVELRPEPPLRRSPRPPSTARRRRRPGRGCRPR